MRILISYNNPALQKVLISKGHEVVCAPSGEAALALFAEGDFDHVITMDGDQLSSVLNALRPR